MMVARLMLKMENKGTISHSIKWAFLTEIIVKLISPITSMILARLIDPGAFGVVSSVLIITAFAEMFTDAGFQSYLIRCQFKSDMEFEKYINVVFWTNFAISACFVVGIFFSAPTLAKIVNVEEYVDAIRIYSCILLLTSYSGTLYAVYRKNFQFKQVGILRIIAKLTPLFTTVPLAFLGMKVWAIIIGNLISELVIDILLFLRSEIKIGIYYNVSYLMKMAQFSVGILLNSIVGWVMTNLSIVMIGVIFSVYDQGLYQMSFNLVGQITSVITASTMGVFFSDLSVKQNDDRRFRETVYDYQKGIGIISIPLGVGFFVFRNFVTDIFLGGLYRDATMIVGTLGLVLSESITYLEVGQSICIAKGKPYFVAIGNAMHVVLIGILFWIFRDGDSKEFLILLCVIKLQIAISHFCFAKQVSGIRFIRSFLALLPYYIASFVMACAGWIVLWDIHSSKLAGVAGIGISVAVYFGVLVLLPKTRCQVTGYMSGFRNTILRMTRKNV